MTPHMALMRESEAALRNRCDILLQMLILANGAEDSLYLQMEQALQSGSRSQMEEAIAAYDDLDADSKFQIEGALGATD